MQGTRRNALKLGVTGLLAAPAHALAGGASAAPACGAHGAWPRGIENQRQADLGNGSYLNPIFPGDHPDPTILKDGENYYMTFSSFEALPGLLIWHSTDLVNWQPLAPALQAAPGIIFAVDLAKHNGRFFIYIPVIPKVFTAGAQAAIYVIHADTIAGPWSDPIDLGIRGFIDPGHIVGEDGSRYLFLSGVSRVRLTDDGLATAGPVEHVYDGWNYPSTWITEARALEGPKLLRHGGYFYLISAEGGTSGPPTGHMVIAARSRSIHGPWENCPANPIVRTTSEAERWWSRGHATLVEAPGGAWYMVYHGYENGFRTLGRQTLLQPIEWTDDGWFRALGGDLSQPLPKPLPGQKSASGIPRSDDFSGPAFGTRWNFYSPDAHEPARARFNGNRLILAAKGAGPQDCSPLAGLVGDHAYEISVAIELDGSAQAGLLLFFNRRMFLGMGHDSRRMTTYKAGQISFWQEPAPQTRSLHLKIVNDSHIVTFFYSLDGVHWITHGLRCETSGCNANTMDDLASLRPALFVAGRGEAAFRDFRFRAL
jgi:xylan 1,4-beta-xylosidase